MSLNTEQIKKVIDDKRTVVLNQSQNMSRIYKYLSGNQVVYDSYVIKDPNNLDNAQLYFTNDSLVIDSENVNIKGALEISGSLNINLVNAGSTTFTDEVRITNGGLFVSGNSTFNSYIGINNVGFLNVSSNNFNLGTKHVNGIDNILNIACEDETKVINIGCTNDSLREINIGSGGSGNTIITIGSLGDTVIINATANYISINDLKISDKTIILNSVSGTIINSLNTSGAGILISDGLNEKAGYIITDPNTGAHFHIKTPISDYYLSTPDLYDFSTIIVQEDTSKTTKLNNTIISGNANFINSLVNISGFGLILSGNATFSNSLNVNNDTLIIDNSRVFISGPLNITGNVLINNNLAVKETLTIDKTFQSNSNAFFNNSNVLIQGSLNVSGNTILKNLNVQENVVLNNSNLNMTGNLNISGNFRLDGTITTSGFLQISGLGLILTGNATMSNSLSVSGLSVENDLIVKKNLVIENDITVNSNANFNNSNVSISGLLNISGAGANITGSMNISRNLSIQNGLFLANNATFNNSIVNVSGILNISGGGLVITGNTRLQNLFVKENALFNDSIVSISGKLRLTGDAELNNSNLSVSGNILVNNVIKTNGIISTGTNILNGNLLASGNISLSGNLNTQGNALLSSNAIINNNITTLSNTYSTTISNSNYVLEYTLISPDSNWVAFGGIVNGVNPGIIIVNSRTNNVQYLVGDQSINTNYVNYLLFKTYVVSGNEQKKLHIFSNNNQGLIFQSTTTLQPNNTWDVLISEQFQQSLYDEVAPKSFYFSDNNNFIRSYITLNNAIGIDLNFQGLYVSGYTIVDTESQVILRSNYGDLGKIYTDSGVFTDIIKNTLKIETAIPNSYIDLGCNDSLKEINIASNNSLNSRTINIGSENDVINIFGAFNLVGQAQDNQFANVLVNNPTISVNAITGAGSGKIDIRGVGILLGDGINNDAGYIRTATDNGDRFIFKAFTGPNSAPNTRVFELSTPVLTTTSVILVKDTQTNTLNIENVSICGLTDIGKLRNYVGIDSTGFSNFTTLSVNNRANLQNLNVTQNSLLNFVSVSNLNISANTTFNSNISILATFNTNRAIMNTLQSLSANINKLQVSEELIIQGFSTFNSMYSKNASFNLQSTEFLNVNTATFNSQLAVIGNLNIRGVLNSTGISNFDLINVDNLNSIVNATFTNLNVQGGLFISGNNNIITGGINIDNLVNTTGNINSLSSNRIETNTLQVYTLNSTTSNLYNVYVDNYFLAKNGLNTKGNVQLDEGYLTVNNTSNFTKYIEINAPLKVQGNASFNSNIQLGELGLITNNTLNNELSIDLIKMNITSILSIGDNSNNKIINIGNGDNSTISIGNNNNTINLQGDINYIGTINANDLTIQSKYVVDKQIYLNTAGNQQPKGSGVFINGGNQVQTLGYIQTDSNNADTFIIKAPYNNFILSTPVLTSDSTILVKDNVSQTLLINNINSNEAIFNNSLNASGLTISNNALIKNLNVSNSTTLNNLVVINNATFDNLVFNNLISNGTSTFNSFVNLSKGLVVSGLSTFNSNVYISGNAFINPTYSLDSRRINTADLRITGTLNMSGILNLSGSANITGGLNLDNLVLRTGTINSLSISNSIILNNGLVASGNITFNNSNIIISGSLNISGNAVLTGNTRLNGIITVSGNLTATGNSTFNNINVRNLTVLDNLNVISNLNLTGVLNISALNITNNLYVNGDGFIKNQEILTINSLNKFGNAMNLLTLDGINITFGALTGSQIFLANNSLINNVSRLTQAGLSGFCNVINTDNNIVYIGGSFIGVGGINVLGLAYWNSETQEWGSLGNVNGVVNSIVISKDKSIYIGGSFNTISGLGGYNSLSVYKSGNWNRLGGGVNGLVNSLAIKNNILYVGGSFNSVSGASIVGLASYDLNANTWNSLGNVGGRVNTIAFDNLNNLLIGGTFINVSGLNVQGIAKRNNTTNNWSSIGNINGIVNSIKVSTNNDMYIGGTFTTVSGINCNTFIKYSNNNWDTMGIQVSGTINTLEFDIAEHNLYIGGTMNEKFYYYDTINSSLHALEFGSNIYLNGIINSLKSNDKNEIYLGGNQTNGIGDLAPSQISNIMKLSSNYKKTIIFDTPVCYINTENQLLTVSSYTLNQIGQQVSIYFNEYLNNGFLLNQTITGISTSGGVDFNTHTTFNAGVDIIGDLVVYSNLNVNGNSNMNNLNSTNLNISDRIIVSNGASISGLSNIDTINNNILVSNIVNANFLNVTNTSNLFGNVFMNNNATINNSITINNNANVNNNLTVSGISTLRNNVNVNGNLVLTGNAFVSNNATFNGNVSVSGTVNTINLYLNGGQLGTQANSTCTFETFRINTENINDVYLVNSSRRTENGTNWWSVSNRIQQVVDDVKKSYIEFNPSASSLQRSSLAFGTENTERMRILANGNVGIGATEPYSRLCIDTNGINDINLPLQMNVPLNNERWLGINYDNQYCGLFGVGLGDVIVRNARQGFPIKFILNDPNAVAAVRMIINSNGNVGIGMTNPTSNLTIQGVGASSNKTTLEVAGTSGGLRSGTLLRNDGSTNMNQGPDYGSNAILRIQNDNNNQTWNYLTCCNSTSTATNSSIFVINGSGNVGIGTNSPFSKLHVQGAVCLEAENIPNSIDPAVDPINKTNTYIRFGSAGTNTDWAYLRQIGGDNNITLALDFHDDATDSNFIIRNVQSTASPDIIRNRFCVNSNGYVGIGRDDPNNFLDIYAGVLGQTVNNSIPIQNFETVSEGSNTVRFQTTARRTANGNTWNTHAFRQQVIVDITPKSFIEYNSGADNISFGNNNTTQMLLNSFGNLGIGSTSPLGKLDVRGETIISADGTNLCVLNGDGNGAYFGSKNNAPVRFLVNYVDRMRLDTAGNLGIGTTEPQQRLQVIGTSDGNGVCISSGANTTGHGGALSFGIAQFANFSPMSLIQGYLTNALIPQNQLQGGIIFKTRVASTTSSTMTDRMIISHDGNVGIGTNNPGTRLDVRGLGNYTISTTQNIGLTINNTINTQSNPGEIAINNGNHIIRFISRAGSGAYNSLTTGDDKAIIFSNNNSINSNGNLTIGPHTSAALGIKIMGDNGYVGINVGNPLAPLHVFGFVTAINIGTYYLNSGTIFTVPPAIPNHNISIRSSHGIWTEGGSFIGSSDLRIKKSIQEINTRHALETIKKISPKTYKYIDNTKNTSNYNYGFVAQEVQTVLESAVSKQKNVIPSIFCKGIIRNLILTSDNPHKITNEKTLKLYDEKDNPLDVDILEILDDYRLRINKSFIKDNKEDEKVFIYGPYVDDFLVLDKDVIFTVSVAAIKELDQKVEKLEKTVAEQQETIDKLLSFIKSKFNDYK